VAVVVVVQVGQPSQQQVQAVRERLFLNIQTLAQLLLALVFQEQQQHLLVALKLQLSLLAQEM
jgi:hypothetical protein